MNLNLKDIGWIMVVVPLVFQLAFALLFTSIQSDAEERILELNRARQLMYLMQSLSIKEQELFLDVHQFAVTREPDHLENYKKRRIEVKQMMRQAKAVTRHYSRVAAEFDSSAIKTDEFLDRLEWFRIRTINKIDQKITPQSTDLSSFFKGSYDYIEDTQKFARTFEDRYRATQRELLPEIESETEQSNLLLWFFMILYVGFTILLAVVFTRGTSNRFSRLLNNTRSRMTNSGTEERLGGTDELATLDEMLNTMADSAEQANLKVINLVENSIDILCSISSAGKFISINSAVIDSWGYEKEELIDRKWTSVLPEKDKAEGLKRFEDAKQSGEETFELPVVRADGTLADMLWSVSYIKEEGSFVCIIHDDTETKRVERKIQESERETTAIISALPVGIATIDATGGITSSNPALDDLLSIEASPPQESNLPSLLPGFGEGHLELNSLLRRAPGDAAEVTVERAGMEPLTVELTLSRIRSADDLSYLATVRDVSQRHRLDKLRRELLAIVSHDLRTPLTTVSGTFALLDEGVYGRLPEKYTEIVRQSESEIDQLTELTNDLLDIEKLESGAGGFDLEPESIVDTIRDAELSLRSSLQEKQLHVQFEANKDAQVNVDGERLFMAVQTLIRNAARRSPAGENIIIETGIEDSRVVVEIIDRGTILSEEDQLRLFDRMTSYDESSASEQSRLKLPVAKAIVEAFGGRIGVKSTADDGTRFWFSLPIHLD